MNTSSTQSAQRSDYVHTHLTEVLFNRHVTSLAAYDDFPPSMQWDADKRQASRGWHLNPKPSWTRAFSLTAAAKRHSSCAAYLSSQQGGEPTTYIVVRAREKRSPAQSRSGRRQRRGISTTGNIQRESTTLQTAGVAIAVYNYDDEYWTQQGPVHR